MEKLNPDGDCLGIAIQYILNQYGVFDVPVSTLKELNNPTDFLKIFNQYKLNYKIYLPVLSYIYPGTWYFYFKFQDNIISPKQYYSIKGQLIKEQKKYFTLYHLTAKQLYNISNEYWTHYVVGTRTNNELFTLYDPLKEIIEEEIKRTIIDVNEPFLDKLSAYKIIIF